MVFGHGEVQSSTLREILAVRKVLESFAPKLAGLCVKWFTDNQNVARIIDIGSPKLPLQEEAKRIFHICILHGIQSSPNGCLGPVMSKLII